jgi:vacuolar-type H+-ATPase subunit I/STV1
MKKYNFVFLLIFLIAPVSSMEIMAQSDEKEDRIERLKSQKVAFLTEQVGLSSSDAEKFWPVYNKFSSRMDELWRAKKTNIKELYKSLDTLSDTQKQVAIDRHIEFELQKAKLEKEYHEKFKQILTIDQVIKLYGAEHDFKKKMLHLIRGGKQSSCKDCDELPDHLAKS